MKTSSVTGDTGEAHGTSATSVSRRDVLTKTAGGALAATAFGAVPLRGYAAEPVNIGGLYPVTGRMAQLVGEKPKVAVIFENTAFGTSTSNGLREKAPGEGVEIVLFEPYSAGFADASPLINKVKASGADMLFSVSYLNDLILIVRTIKQVGLKIGLNGGSGGFVIPDFYKTVGSLADGLQGVAHWNHDSDENAQKVNAVYQKTYGEFLFEYAGGLVAQTFMLADGLERAASTDPQKVLA